MRIGKAAAALIIVAATVPFAGAAFGVPFSDRTARAAAGPLMGDGPWEVKACGRTVALVHTEEEGRVVIEGLRIEYGDGPAGAASCRPEGLMTVEKAETRAYRREEVSDAASAVKDIVRRESISREHGTEGTGVEIAVAKTVEDTETIERPVRVVSSKKMDAGEITVRDKGADGKKEIVREVTLRNGEVEKSRITASRVTKKAEPAVVCEGSGLPAEEMGELVIDYASNFIGTKYVWGGTDLREGTDCSGFTKGVYAFFGVEIPRHSSAQAEAGTEVDIEDARAGDIVCYEGHVALYIGGGKIIHATPGEVQIGEDAEYRPIVSVRRIFSEKETSAEDLITAIGETEPNDAAKEFAKERSENRKKRKAERAKKREEKIRELLEEK